MNRWFVSIVLALATTTAALAQTGDSVRVRGTVVAFEGGVLSVTTSSGTEKISTPATLRVQSIVKTDLSHLTPGSWVGCAATPLPDGTLRAIEIHIFPPGATPGAGSRPYDLGPSSVMTNGSVDTIAAAVVEGAAAHSIVIKYPDGEKTVVIPPTTPIVTYAKGDASLLVPGAHVVLTAARGTDGALSAASVNVGKDGLVPPM